MEVRFIRKVDSQLLRLDAFTHTYTRSVRALSLARKFVYPDAIIVIPYLAISCGTLAFASRSRHALIETLIRRLC